MGEPMDQQDAGGNCKGDVPWRAPFQSAGAECVEMLWRLWHHLILLEKGYISDNVE